MKQAAKMSKKKRRKLIKLQEKKEADAKRLAIYKSLSETAISTEEQKLLLPSGNIGQLGSKRERVKRAFRLNKAGIPLTNEETEILLVRNDKVGSNSSNSFKEKSNICSVSKETIFDGKKRPDNIENFASQNESIKDQSITKEECKIIKAKTEMAELKSKKEAAKKEALLLNRAKNIAIIKAQKKELHRVQNAPTTCVVHIDRNPEIQEQRLKLPVCGIEQEIIESVQNNDVIILCGATGSGKTTQTPQFLYEAGYSTAATKRGMIGVTQPRRVAAMSMGTRVAEELNTPLGKRGFVSYHVRHDSSGVHDGTRIKFMTEGVWCRDLLLKQYSAIIIDEAHERNLDTDVLLGLLSREVCPGENFVLPPLKLIIMSATLKVSDFIDNKRLFSKPPPVIKADSRRHPVTIHFNRKTPLNDYLKKVVSKVGAIHKKLPEGTIVVFLPGRKEIEWVCRKLRRKYGHRANIDCQITPNEHSNETSTSNLNSEKIENSIANAETNVDDVDTSPIDDISSESMDEENNGSLLGPSKPSTMPMHVLPMYSMLPKQAQMKVFEPPPPGHRLVVVATNVAESSITIPNTVYIVDSGRERNRVYNATSGISTFEVNWISKASADQRAGRAGRTGPGHAYRLYSSAVFNDYFKLFSPPEILATPLEDVVIHLKRLGIHHVSAFPFPSAPPVSNIRQALVDLWNLGLLNMEGDSTSNSGNKKSNDGELTNLGLASAEYPVSARFGKMLALARTSSSQNVNYIPYVIALVSAMSTQAPFVMSRNKDGSNSCNAIACEIEIDAKLTADEQNVLEKKRKEEQCLSQWAHIESDALSLLRIVGAYSFGTSSSQPHKQREWCEARGLRPKTMREIEQLRIQLSRSIWKHSETNNNKLSKQQNTTKFTFYRQILPPTRDDERFLRQVILSGYLDHVAKRIDNIHGGVKRTKGRVAYRSVNPLIQEELYIHSNSFVPCRPARNGDAPEYVIYNDVAAGILGNPDSRLFMRGVTIIEAKWLPTVANGSPLLHNGDEVLLDPPPYYNTTSDSILCYRQYKYGTYAWTLPLQTEEHPKGSNKIQWFARRLLEGCVVLDPSGSNILTATITKDGMNGRQVDSLEKLLKAWKSDPNFLMKGLRNWLKKSEQKRIVRIWQRIIRESKSSFKNNKKFV
eukprot:GSMAST32.ASY1.ANO1.1638.1 assembled CDS